MVSSATDSGRLKKGCCLPCRARRGPKNETTWTTGLTEALDFAQPLDFSDLEIPGGESIPQLGLSLGAFVVTIPHINTHKTHKKETSNDENSRLRDVLELCRRGEVIKAACLCQDLKTDFANSKHDTACMLHKLRCINGRMQNAMDTVLAPSILPGMKWTSFDMKDNKLGTSFSLEVSLRFVTPEESAASPSKNKTEFFGRGTVRNFPMRISQYVAIQKEIELWKKEWLQDCTSIGGDSGDQQQLYSSMGHVLVSPKLLPMVCLEDCFTREFSVCSEAPMKGVDGRGVMMVEANVPDNVFEQDYEGFHIPKHKRGAISLTKRGAFYLTPSKTNPEWTDLVGAVRMGGPLPQWMLPLDLLKRIIARQMIDSILLMKAHIIDHWESLDFKKRINEAPDFYNSIIEMERRV